MTKPHEDMDVVEMDAIDHGDWETNMSTSELPVAGLAALVRQTAAAPVIERPPLHIAPTSVRPSVSVHTPVPVKVAPSQPPPPEPIVEEPVERLTARLPSRRVLVIAAGAAAVLGIVVGVIVVGGKRSTESAAAAPVVVSAPAPPPAAKPVAAPPAAKPVTASKPAAPTHHAVVATHTPVAGTRVAAAPIHTGKVAAPKRPASHASHAPVAKKHVATRTQPPPSPVEPDVLDRAHVAYNAGNEALFAGDTATAIRSYQEVVGLSPSLAFGYRGLGLAYAQSGDATAAIKALRRYLELAPHAKDAALIRKRLVGLQHTR